MKKIILIALGFIMTNMTNFAGAAVPVDCEQIAKSIFSNSKLNTPLAQAMALEQHLSTCINNEKYLITIAGLYIDAGRFEKANKVTAKGLKSIPTSDDLLDLQAWITYLRGDIATAKKLADKYATVRPNAPTAYLIYASIAAKNKDWDASLRNAQRVYTIKKDPLMLLVMASSMHQLDHHEEAVKLVYRALKEKPELIGKSVGINEAIYSLGALNRLDEAVQLVKEKMRLVPNWREETFFVQAAIRLKVITKEDLN